ncbi:MAG TPA: peroxiredoxin-like family protein [Polyangia bacterium]|nr:peroxiredoxin-like family protein [Polyangia bacterium]
METPRAGAPVPAALADAVVLDERGGERRLGDFWADRPALVVFLRHFGCIGCSAQVTELEPRLAQLDELGMRTVLVGNGAPNFIAGFVERHALADKRAVLVTDPSLAAFRAAGLARSWWATAGPRALADIARALAAGHSGHQQEGDATQQGGALVVAPSGEVAFYYRNRSLGDHAAAADLVDVALGLAARRGATWRI